MGKKMEIPLTVEVSRVVTHPIYGKKIKRSRKYQVHDTTGKFSVGDKVRFTATRPVSATKKWRVLES